MCFVSQTKKKTKVNINKNGQPPRDDPDGFFLCRPSTVYEQSVNAPQYIIVCCVRGKAKP